MAQVPDTFMQRDIDSLSLDEIVYIENDADDFGFDESVVALAYDTSDLEAYLLGDFMIDRDAHKPESLIGRIGIMQCVVSGPQGPLAGFVVDLRHLDDSVPAAEYSKNDMPDDQEDQNDWHRELSKRRTVLAFATRDKKSKEVVMTGETAAFDALAHLVNETDLVAAAIKKKLKREVKQLDKKKANKKEDPKKASVQKDGEKPPKKDSPADKSPSQHTQDKDI